MLLQRASRFFMTPNLTPNSRPGRFKQLTQTLIHLSETPSALWALALVSLIDAAIFPLPPFALLIPMVLARPHRAVRYIALGVVASTLGGMLGYGIGHALRAGLLTFVQFNPDIPLKFHFQSLHVDTTLARALSERFLVLLGVCTVMPVYKVFTIGSGVVGVHFPTFVLASFLGRLIRFSLIGGACALFGKRATRWLQALSHLRRGLAKAALALFKIPYRRFKQRRNKIGP